MGWFSNPNCPRCGKETSVQRDMFESYYTCNYCNEKARKERIEKENLEARIKNLENKLRGIEKDK